MDLWKEKSSGIFFRPKKNWSFQKVCSLILKTKNKNVKNKQILQQSKYGANTSDIRPKMHQNFVYILLQKKEFLMLSLAKKYSGSRYRKKEPNQTKSTHFMAIKSKDQILGTETIIISRTIMDNKHKKMNKWIRLANFWFK